MRSSAWGSRAGFVAALALVLSLVLGLAGCAAPGAPQVDGPREGAGRTGASQPAEPVPARHEAFLALAGERVSVEWHLPPASAAPPRGLVTLQHGFMRQCHHLRGTAAAIARAGLATLCLNTSVAGGNPALAHRLADALAGGQVRLPDGRELPARIVVAGFSAGAHFAVVLGARLVDVAPARVAGAVLLDPVAGRAGNADCSVGGGVDHGPGARDGCAAHATE